MLTSSATVLAIFARCLALVLASTLASRWLCSLKGRIVIAVVGLALLAYAGISGENGGAGASFVCSRVHPIFSW